jgi:hypothetical protein
VGDSDPDRTISYIIDYLSRYSIKAPHRLETVTVRLFSVEWYQYQLYVPAVSDNNNWDLSCSLVSSSEIIPSNFILLAGMPACQSGCLYAGEVLCLDSQLIYVHSGCVCCNKLGN